MISFSRTPSPSNVSSHLLSMIRAEILNGNMNVWPKGCRDIDVLFNFIKGKQLPRARVDQNGNPCKSSTKELCLKGCISGVPCVLAERQCPIRSNEMKIKEFASKMLDTCNDFQFLLDTCNDVHERKFEIQRKLLLIASECDLTHVIYNDENIRNFDKKVLTNDFFKKTLKVNSLVLHAIALAVIEPYVEGINSSIENFIDSYQFLTSMKVEGTKRTCDPSLNPGGWYGTYRASQLTQAFLKIFGSENSQLATSIVCQLSHKPESQSSIHGGRKSPGLTTALFIWQNETQTNSAIKLVSPNSVADVTVTESTNSPREPPLKVDVQDRPLKKPKEEEPRKTLFLQAPFEWPKSCDFITPDQLEHNLMDTDNLIHNDDSVCNFDMNCFYGECDQEIMDYLSFSDMED